MLLDSLDRSRECSLLLSISRNDDDDMCVSKLSEKYPDPIGVEVREGVHVTGDSGEGGLSSTPVHGVVILTLLVTCKAPVKA